MEFLPFLILITLIAVIGAAFMRIVEMISAKSGRRGGDHATKIMPYMYLEQLDPDTMKPYQHFPMDERVLRDRGYSISGSHAAEGDIRLSGRFEQAQMVHTNHAIVCMDDQGCYITDNDSINHMRLPNTREAVKQLEIHNGMVVYLGPQPIRFVFAKLEGPDVPAHHHHTRIFAPQHGTGRDGDGGKTVAYKAGSAPKQVHTVPEEPLDDRMKFRSKPVRRRPPMR